MIIIPVLANFHLLRVRRYQLHINIFKRKIDEIFFGVIFITAIINAKQLFYFVIVNCTERLQSQTGTDTQPDRQTKAHRYMELAKRPSLP